MRKDVKRRSLNRSQTSALRTLVKKYRAAVAGGDAAAIDELYKLCSRRFDQAAAKHMIHKNAASRMKSRLALHANKAQAARATSAPTPAAG